MKNCIVTGSSRGIGYATVCDLLEKGCKVYALTSSPDVLNEKLAHNNLRVIHLDLRSDESIASATKEVMSDTSEIDLLINNAGYLLNESFEQISREQLIHIYSVNVFGQFLLTKQLIPLLKASRESHVVMIGSIGGNNGTLKFPGLSAYSSSKGALHILTECLAEEYKESTIHFNVLALGAVQTEMLEEAFPGYQAPVTPKEVAEYVSDFGINKRKYHNGKIISVSSTNP